MGNRSLQYISALVLISSVVGAAACAADAGIIDDDAGVINYTPSDASAPKGDAKSDAPVTTYDSSTPSDGGLDAHVDSGDAAKPLDAGDAGIKDGGSDAGDGGSPVTCNATNSCATATSLGSVSGDKGSDVVSKSGYLSGWYKVDVTEDDSSIGAVDLSAQISLGSPVGANYDLYVYDGAGCTTLMDQSTNLTGTDSVNPQWKDEKGVFGHDDSKTLYIYVKYQSGDCKSSSPWSLQVRGHYP